MDQLNRVTATAVEAASAIQDDGRTKRKPNPLWQYWLLESIESKKRKTMNIYLLID